LANLPKTADDWLQAIHQEFGSESDRAAAIVVGAMLDDALKALLEKKLAAPLAKDRSIVDGPNAPIDSFSSRIDASCQLGLISHYLARDLHLIRKIRNEFAHTPLECTFGSERVMNWVRALEEASDYNKRNPETRKALGPPGPRWDFLGIAAWILYSLHREIDETQALEAHGPEFGYIDWNKLAADLQSQLADP
jgi:hypothetical protein